MSTVINAGIIASGSINPALAAAADFGPSNPFFAPSTLPFQAPPFDKIKDATTSRRSKRAWRSS